MGVGNTGDAEVTADEEHTGYFKVTSSDWSPNQAVEWAIDPMHAIEATSGEQWGVVTRCPVDKRLAGAGSTVLEESFVKDTVTAAGTLDWCVYARYIATPKP